MTKKTRSCKESPVVLLETLRNQDEFGEPITLNYKGSDTLKTIPGALISILAKAFLALVLWIMSTYILKRSNWSMTDQEVIIEEDDFKNEMNIGQNYTQFQAGFVYKPIAGVFSNREEFVEVTEKYNRFLTFI